MDVEELSAAEIAAAHLALVVATIHLSLGLLNWIKWASAGFLLPRDVRWPLFVVSGAALLIAMPFALRDDLRRPVLAGGLLLSLGYAAGYFGWHLGGHRPLLIAGTGSVHEGPLLPLLVDHLFAGPVEFLSVAASLALAACLAYLLLEP